MFRRFLVVILLVLSPLAAKGELVTPSNRVTSHVNVRAAPSGNATRVGTLLAGETAELLERVPRWYRIRLGSGQDGFVSKSWAVVLPEGNAVGLAARQTDELRIHFFNIGAGTCTLIECPGPNARPIVVDCGQLDGSQGPHGISDADLQSRFQSIIGTASPDVVLSHGDTDHYSLITQMLQGINAHAIWQGDDPSQYNSALQGWLTSQKDADATLHQNLGMDWHNGGDPIGADLDCGAADAFVLTVNSGTSGNDKSLVLMLEYQDFTAIFSGDATGTTELQAATNFSGNLKTTVLTGSHHGSNTHGSNGTAWASATAPEIVVYSAGTRFGHPRCLATNRVDDTLASVPLHNAICGTSNTDFATSSTTHAEYMTRVNGAVVITTNGVSPLQVNCEVGPGCSAQVPF